VNEIAISHRASTANTTFQVRPGTADDLAIVTDSWVKSFVPSDRAARLPGWWGDPTGDRYIWSSSHALGPNVWYRMHRAMVGELLDRCALLVLCTPSAPEVVLAWVAFDADEAFVRLHYAWTRPELRRRGHGRTLIAEARSKGGDRLWASHMTPDGAKLIGSAS